MIIYYSKWFKYIFSDYEEMLKFAKWLYLILLIISTISDCSENVIFDIRIMIYFTGINYLFQYYNVLFIWQMTFNNEIKKSENSIHIRNLIYLFKFGKFKSKNMSLFVQNIWKSITEKFRTFFNSILKHKLSRYELHMKHLKKLKLMS